MGVWWRQKVRWKVKIISWKSECKSQGKLRRQNVRASVVSSVVSSLGLTSSLSAPTGAGGPSPWRVAPFAVVHF